LQQPDLFRIGTAAYNLDENNASAHRLCKDERDGDFNRRSTIISVKLSTYEVYAEAAQDARSTSEQMGSMSSSSAAAIKSGWMLFWRSLIRSVNQMSFDETTEI
jgi:dTDP-D-glucose 4,6-dehydratase